MICPRCGHLLTTIDFAGTVGHWNDDDEGWRFEAIPRKVNPYGTIVCTSCRAAKRYLDGGAIGWSAREGLTIYLVPFEAGRPGDERL